MGPLVLKAFGGMVPITDSRLLPNASAEEAVNVWLYSGTMEGLREPTVVHSLLNSAARYVYRVPTGPMIAPTFGSSYWLEFNNINTTVVKSPVREQADPTFYWADGAKPPGYTSRSRLAASLPALVLGIPSPAAKPTVTASGGVSVTNETRIYAYTWVSSFGEEGPPSPPSDALTAKVDDTWAVAMTAPSGDDTTDRDLTHTNIYRTITSDQGQTLFFFVAQVPIATLSYNDTLSSATVSGHDPLPSTTWTGPPADLEGIVSMANGIVAGWRGTEIWFSEPYRPHAWPVGNTINVDYEIVGMGALDQMLVVGTESFPYICTGTDPRTMSLRLVAAAEPCIARGSFVVVPTGVLFASPNGLILVNQSGGLNITQPFISKDKWAELLNLAQMRAGLLNGAYFVFSGVQEGAFQADAFQNDAFQMEDQTGTREGGLIEFRDQRIAYVKLQNDDPTYNVSQDPWTGELLVIRNGQVLTYDLTRDFMGEYTWRSKVFQLPMFDNLGAVKVTWSPPLGVTGPAATTVMRTYAGGVLRQTKTLPASGKIFRLPSGFKSDNYQFELEGNLVIHQIEVASTVAELQKG